MRKPLLRASQAAAVCAAIIATIAASNVRTPLRSADPSGTLSTTSTTGNIDVTQAFFQNIGTNGRTCNSCHVSSNAWGTSPAELQTRFFNSKGSDPVFAPVDGTDCPTADRSSTEARRQASSLLLSKGLIRVSLAVPQTADFQITDIQDPYHCAATTATNPSFYRRPLPSVNLRFLTTVMWDGRESHKGSTLAQNLAQQAVDATTGHAEGTVPSDTQVQQIVNAEMSLTTAQFRDTNAGKLGSDTVFGGPDWLAKQAFYVGINDALGGDPQGKPFNNVAFTMFDAWAGSPDAYKQSVLRGQTLFNTLPITITGVAGLNDLPGLSTVQGFCTTCHDTPNVGNHSVPLAINIGVTDYPAVPALDIKGLPAYTVMCSDGTVKKTTDLGRAMVTGNCADVGKTKGPILRGLAARAPYFHNGSAATLMDVVDFYDQRFSLNLTSQNKQDLVAFLSAL